jgi:hypothetical protein
MMIGRPALASVGYGGGNIYIALQLAELQSQIGQCVPETPQFKLHRNVLITLMKFRGHVPRAP